MMKKRMLVDLQEKIGILEIDIFRSNSTFIYPVSERECENEFVICFIIYI